MSLLHTSLISTEEVLMNGDQVAVLKSALIRCALIVFAIVVSIIILNVISYNVGAKTDLAISSDAAQQLVDGGQTYQQMKTMGQNFFQFNSIFFWIKLFVILSGIGYFVYQAFSAYKHIVELGSKKE